LYAVSGNDPVETIATSIDCFIEHHVSSVSADSVWLAKKILANDDKKSSLTKEKNLLTIRKH